jgi:predicted CoA-binding protein
MKKENVAIIGASDKPERYAYKAMKLLIEYGHNVFLVSPSHQEINGMTVYSSITEINEKIDTVTLYISDRLQNADVQEGILNATPKRVIFNPGTENK